MTAITVNRVALDGRQGNQNNRCLNVPLAIWTSLNEADGEDEGSLVTVCLSEMYVMSGSFKAPTHAVLFQCIRIIIIIMKKFKINPHTTALLSFWRGLST